MKNNLLLPNKGDKTMQAVSIVQIRTVWFVWHRVAQDVKSQ